MSSGNLTTKDGKKVPAFPCVPQTFLDKTIVLYGKSNSGKTTIVKHILYTLKNRVPLAFVISPTEPSNHAYEGFINKALIHYDLDVDKKNTETSFLHKFWEWQEIRASIYNKANDLNVLKSLVSKTNDPNIHLIIKKIEQKRTAFLSECMESKVADINRQCDDLIKRVYKKCINQNRYNLNRIVNSLNEGEKYSLKFININPRVVLIFDDCAAEIKAISGSPIFKKLFYQSRHSYLTIMFCCQDDTDLTAALRKNAAINIFTQAIVANANFSRPSNKFGKDVISYCSSIAPDVFVGHRKMVYMDNDPNRQYFYHLTAQITPEFQFGSTSVNGICNKVKTESGNIDRTNKYYRHFKV